MRGTCGTNMQKEQTAPQSSQDFSVVHGGLCTVAQFELLKEQSAQMKTIDPVIYHTKEIIGECRRKVIKKKLNHFHHRKWNEKFRGRLSEIFNSLKYLSHCFCHILKLF